MEGGDRFCRLRNLLVVKFWPNTARMITFGGLKSDPGIHSYYHIFYRDNARKCALSPVGHFNKVVCLGNQLLQDAGS